MYIKYGETVNSIALGKADWTRLMNLIELGLPFTADMDTRNLANRIKQEDSGLMFEEVLHYLMKNEPSEDEPDPDFDWSTEVEA